MGKGLYHCSRCKKHFYDHEATAMHIKDAHDGVGEVLRHPTKRELLLRDQQQRDRIEALEAENARLRQIERNVQSAREHEHKRAEAALAENARLRAQLEDRVYD